VGEAASRVAGGGAGRRDSEVKQQDVETSVSRTLQRPRARSSTRTRRKEGEQEVVWAAVRLDLYIADKG